MNYQNRADLAIAQGALTNSKRPSTFVRGIYPTHATKGRGCMLVADGEYYTDYICALGTNLLGYGNPLIAEAVNKRFLDGATLSLSSELEVEVAEKLKSVVSWTELWKFTKTGTEAANAAVRIARAYTGRGRVLSSHYHGWGDDFVSLTPPAVGVPERTWMASLDDHRNLIAESAAVIIEPVVTDFSKERRFYLEALRDECKKHGTLLIFDEIITGFRFPGLTVSKYFGVEPDLILLGKAMGGGLPLSAVGGRKDVMSGEYFVSGTFFGEQVSLAACNTLIDLMRRDGSKYAVKDLWEAGETFLSRFNELSPYLKIKGYPTRGVFEGDQKMKALFWQEACKAKILFGPSWFFNFPLVHETPGVLAVCKAILDRIHVGAVTLEGEMPAVPYAQAVRS